MNITEINKYMESHLTEGDIPQAAENQQIAGAQAYNLDDLIKAAQIDPEAFRSLKTHLLTRGMYGDYAKLVQGVASRRPDVVEQATGKPAATEVQDAKTGEVAKDVNPAADANPQAAQADAGALPPANNVPPAGTPVDGNPDGFPKDAKLVKEQYKMIQSDINRYIKSIKPLCKGNKELTKALDKLQTGVFGLSMNTWKNIGKGAAILGGTALAAGAIAGGANLINKGVSIPSNAASGISNVAGGAAEKMAGGENPFNVKSTAKDVANGKYGVGQQRIDNMTKAGFTPDQINQTQNYINSSPAGQQQIAAYKTANAAGLDAANARNEATAAMAQRDTFANNYFKTDKNGNYIQYNNGDYAAKGSNKLATNTYNNLSANANSAAQNASARNQAFVNARNNAYNSNNFYGNW